MRSPCADPIFVLGIMPRSGTNFLWDLLRLHPDCEIAREPIWEDNLLARAGLLRAYARETSATWQEVGAARSELEGLLCRSIGDGLIAFLSTAQGKRLLTKTPHVHHLDEFFTFFPSAHLLILVRDGRSVVTSALATFGGRFDSHARLWARAADAIWRFDRANAGGVFPYRIVRYEDLASDVVGQTRSLLSFLDLDPGRYDFEAALQLPVRGSSVSGHGSGRVHWAPVAKPSDFDPIERFRHWTPRMHERFNWIAGRQLERCGYEPVTRGGPSVVRNVALDVAWACARPIRPVRRRLLAAAARRRRG